MASIIVRTTKKLISNPPFSSRQLARFCSKTNDNTTTSSSHEKETLKTQNIDEVGFKFSEEAVKLRAKTNGGYVLVITDPRSAPEFIDENTRDIVQAEREIYHKEQSRFGTLYQFVGNCMKVCSAATFHSDDVQVRNAIVEIIEKMSYIGLLGDDAGERKKKCIVPEAEVTQKLLLQVPMITLFHSYKIVGDLVIIHIDYDRALDALVKLMADNGYDRDLEEFLYVLQSEFGNLVDHGDKNNDLSKRKLPLEPKEKLRVMIQELESKNKGMLLSKKLALVKAALMLYLGHAYPMVGGAITIVDLVATQLPWSQAPPKDNATLKSCDQGLLIILDAPGFETTDLLKVRVEKESLMVEGGAMTTVGYKPMYEKVEIPGGHVYDQDQVVADLSHGQLKILFPFASHNEKAVDSFKVKWGKIDLNP